MENIANLVESILNFSACFGTDLKVNRQPVGMGEITFYVLIFVCIVVERLGVKPLFTVENLLLQIVTERLARLVLHNADTDEIKMHQYAELAQFIFLAHDFAGVACSEIALNDFLDTVCQFVFVNQLKEYPTVRLWVILLIPQGHAVCLLYRLGIHDHLLQLRDDSVECLRPAYISAVLPPVCDTIVIEKVRDDRLAGRIHGIVELLSALRRIRKLRKRHRTIEVVFSASEEYFVQGAERLRYDTLTAKKAFILDTDGEIGRAVIAAPTGVRIVANLTGKAAHAALKPEDGINAIAMAADAVSGMRLGRVDAYTTANIGIIKSGDSGNIVPETCFVEGETRSLLHESALRQRDHMVKCFQDAAEKHGGTCDVETTLVYNAWALQEDSELWQRFKTACEKHGIVPSFESACGGSDASMMSAHGIECLVVATGMHEIHSVREYTTLGEMDTMANVVFHLMIDD